MDLSDILNTAVLLPILGVLLYWQLVTISGGQMLFGLPQAAPVVFAIAVLLFIGDYFLMTGENQSLLTSSVQSG